MIDNYTMENQHLSDAHHFYYQTTFQEAIEHSLQLSTLVAPEETPYVFKYQAIEILKATINSNETGLFNFIIEIVLGELYSDVEQTSDSIRSYERALHNYQNLTCISNQDNSQESQYSCYRFAHYLLVIYNMLGLSYINKDQNQEGLGCFAKSMDLYKEIINLKNKFNDKIEDCYHNRSDEAKGRSFRCYYEGGINFEQVQSSHTLTLFYLAQTYTKLGYKQKAAESCGKTLQRQFDTNKYEVKEFCFNLIGLAEYYQGNGSFAQAQYLLMVGVQVLADENKTEMKAKLQIALGQLYGSLLQFCANRIREKNPISQNDIAECNKEFLLFKSFKQDFPKVSMASNLEECKSLFRKSNTQFKKALQLYVLDGYVTQHIDILFAISKLYHNLCKVDLSRERVSGMLEKRREMLEPLIQQLNPKAFPATWQRILVQTSQIYSDLFQLKNIIALDVRDQTKISEDKLKACVKLGQQLNTYYSQIIKVLESDTESEKNEQYYRSIINSKFNMAKMSSKMYSREPKVRVEFLKRSWTQYKEVAAYINNLKKFKRCFEKQLELTNEMIAMLPTKMDRINYGQVSPFQ